MLCAAGQACHLNTQEVETVGLTVLGQSGLYAEPLHLKKKGR